MTSVVAEGPATPAADEGPATSVVVEGPATPVADEGPATSVVVEGPATPAEAEGLAAGLGMNAASFLQKETTRWQVDEPFFRPLIDFTD